MILRASPFHARVVEANHLNAWQNRGGFTLASHYGSVEEEAVAARFGAVLCDLSWHWQVEFSGTRAEEFVARFFTRNVAALGEGAAMDVLWLNDAGATRGGGTVLRYEDGSFLLTSTQEDRAWLEAAAALFGVEVREQNETEGVLAVIGPAAAKVLAAAGLEPGLLPMRFVRRDWRGVSVILSRLGLGFEIRCAADDALIVWDRLTSAGGSFALLPAGLQALDTLEFESGILRAGRDYQPARDGFTPQPGPHALGLCGLVDRTHFFNGRAAYLAAGPDTAISGIVFDAAAPVPDAPVMASGREVGRAFASRWSPALRAAAAFAVVKDCEPGTAVECGDFHGRMNRLPFLPVPAAASATETGELFV